MSAYYNENDPGAAAWLRELISAGLIAPGEVDERSIEHVQADDLAGFRQCHFFAGIGGWSYALRLAGWPDDRPVWTGSCPCQPFSTAGKRAGFEDPRHLWPAWWRIMRERRPAIVFGEQTSSPGGRAWLDLVSADVEGDGYAIGAADLCAAGVGSPQIRHRLYWGASRVGDSLGARLEGQRGHGDGRGEPGRLGPDAPRPAAAAGAAGGLAEPHGGDSGAEWQQRGGEQRQQPAHRGAGGLADSAGERRDGRPGPLHPRPAEQWGAGHADDGAAGGLADPGRAGDERVRGSGEASGAQGPDEGEARQRQRGGVAAGAGGAPDAERPGPLHGFWRDADWLGCRDGKWRPVEPGTFPLADGIPGRLGLLRGYGNAIVPQVAAAFVTAFDAARA